MPNMPHGMRTAEAACRVISNADAHGFVPRFVPCDAMNVMEKIFKLKTTTSETENKLVLLQELHIVYILPLRIRFILFPLLFTAFLCSILLRQHIPPAAIESAAQAIVNCSLNHIETKQQQLRTTIIAVILRYFCCWRINVKQENRWLYSMLLFCSFSLWWRRRRRRWWWCERTMCFTVPMCCAVLCCVVFMRVQHHYF